MRYNFESAVYLTDALESIFDAKEEDIQLFFERLNGLNLTISSKQLVLDKAKQMLLDGKYPNQISKALDINLQTVYYLRRQLFKEVTNEEE